MTVSMSGQPVTISGNIITFTFISGLVNANSGIGGVAMNMAGIYRAGGSGAVTVLASGMMAMPSLSYEGDLMVDIDVADSSGLNVRVESGIYVNIGLPTAALSANNFNSNTSGTIGPNVAGRKHIIQMNESNVIWIGGAAAGANSGVGFMWLGIPGTDPRTRLELEVANLNQLYFKAQAVSGRISHLSMK
jgi:hypothetical protein